MSEPLRILHVVPTYLPATRYGGPIHSVHGLCRGLVAQGQQVEVFTTNVDGPVNSSVPTGKPVPLDGVQVTYFPSSRLRRLYWSTQMARALAARVAEFQVVHLHSVFLFPTNMAAWAARRAGVPYVLAPRGMLVPELITGRQRLIKTTWLRLIERHCIEGAAALHATSAAEVADMGRAGVDVSRATVIPNGVDMPGPTDLLPEALGPVQARGAFALFLGRVSWKKGLDRLAEALARCSARVVVAGGDDEGYLETFRQAVERAGVTDRVQVLGEVQGDAKRWLLSNCRFVILPSYNENFGNVVLEALASGRPALVTPEVGAAQLVRDSGGGTVAASGEPPELARCIEALWQDPDGCDRMGEAGRRYAAEHLTWPAVAVQTLALYRRLLADRRP